MPCFPCSAAASTAEASPVSGSGSGRHCNNLLPRSKEKCLGSVVSKPNWPGFIWAFLVFCYARPVLGIAGQADIQYSWLTVSHTSIVTSVKPFRLLLSIDQLLLLCYFSVSFCLEHSPFTN